MMRHRSGFSLLEVLVALVIFAIGLLGIATLLLVAHKTNSSNYIKQQAVQSAYNILDRMHANRQTALTGSYNVNNLVTSGTPSIPNTPSPDCSSASCTTTQLATYDTWYWLAKDLTQLPNGCGKITTAASGVSTVFTITVQWDDSPTKQTFNATDLTPTQLIVQSQF